MWQFVLSAAHCLALFLLCLHGFPVGILGGGSFIIAMAAPGFLPLVPVGFFIVIHLVAVSFQHCPFRALLIKKQKAPEIRG